MATTTVDVYLMDIIIIGLKNSGKSTFLNAFTKPETDSDGWSTGIININEEVDARFIEPPKSYGSNFMWTHELIQDSDPHGFIVMCDSSNHASFGETVGILQTIRSFHPDTPCLLVGNKQDAKGAWLAEDIQLAFSISKDIIATPCDSTDRKQVKNVVIELLTAIWNT